MSASAAPLAAPSCRDAVVVEGDPDAVAAVRQALAKVPWPRDRAGECVQLRVVLHRLPEGLGLHVADPAGRGADRVVYDPETAAELIQSFSSAGFPERAAPTPPEPSRSPRELDDPPPRDQPAAPQPPQSRYFVAGLFESALASDASAWFGGRLHGCVRFGPVCPGIMIRALGDTRISGQSALYKTDRVVADVLAFIDWPLLRHRVLFSPGLGVGVGWMHFGRTDHSPPDDTLDLDRGGLRLATHFVVSIRLVPRVYLDLELGIDIAPIANSTPVATEVNKLAGEPLGFIHFGAGVRYGTQ